MDPERATPQNSRFQCSGIVRNGVDCAPHFRREWSHFVCPYR